jgi:hypothetical protein
MTPTTTTAMATTTAAVEFPVTRAVANADAAITLAKPRRRLTGFRIAELKENIPNILKTVADFWCRTV